MMRMFAKSLEVRKCVFEKIKKVKTGLRYGWAEQAGCIIVGRQHLVVQWQASAFGQGRGCGQLNNGRLGQHGLCQWVVRAVQGQVFVAAVVVFVGIVQIVEPEEMGERKAGGF